MPATTIHLSEMTLGALERLASQHGRSVEDEVRRILDEAVHPRTGLGTALARIGQELGGVNDLELKLRLEATPVKSVSLGPLSWARRLRIVP